jgi:hypothetical protein
MLTGLVSPSQWLSSTSNFHHEDCALSSHVICPTVIHETWSHTSSLVDRQMLQYNLRLKWAPRCFRTQLFWRISFHLNAFVPRLSMSSTKLGPHYGRSLSPVFTGLHIRMSYRLNYGACQGNVIRLSYLVSLMTPLHFKNRSPIK